MMVQPKKAPISVRLPDALVSELEAWATDHGLARNAAVRALIELGLRSPVVPKAVEPEIKRAGHDHRAAKQVAETWGKPAKEPKFKSRLKGEWKAP